jgi:response regulator RpfG family c-di-GMP phosphodiesterase
MAQGSHCTERTIMAILKKSQLTAEASANSQSEICQSILIVDDKDPNLSVMASLLRPFYHILEARDGEEALMIVRSLDKAEQRQLACIISDYRMPRMNGVDFFVKVREITESTPRIMVTGYIDFDAVVDAINRGGISKLLVKPYDANDLLDSLNDAILGARRQAESRPSENSE